MKISGAGICLMLVFGTHVQEFYPHDDDDQKLLETFELMETVIEFQKQVRNVVYINETL